MTQQPNLESLHRGDTVNIDVLFKRLLTNGKEERYDPPSVFIAVEGPDGVQTEYPHPSMVTRVAEGVYRRVHTLNQEGAWWARGRGTDGTINAYTEDHKFVVDETRFE